MAAAPTEAFNDVADKVVAMKELRQKTKAIYKTELSAGQKIYLNAVDRPVSAVLGLGIGIKDIITGKKMPGSYIDDSNFPPRMYVSGAFMSATLKRLPTVTPKWDAKLIEMTKRAFDQCEDVAQTPKMKALKPV